MNVSSLKKLLATLSSSEKYELVSYLEDNLSENIISKLTEHRFVNGLFCPRCGCTDDIVKFGKRNNIQRFRCKSCSRIFTTITNSILMGTHKSFSIWKKYIECLLNNFSIRKSAENCGIQVATAFVWRHKILDAVVAKLKESALKGIVEADETFFTISYKGSKHLPRKPKTRGTKATKRGLSNEQVCVACAIDRNNNVFSKISNLGKISTENLNKVFSNKIEAHSIFCSDSNASYRNFAKTHSFRHIEIRPGKHKNGIYHLNHINSLHSKIKAFIAKFNGVSTKHLNNYLAWSSLNKMTTAEFLRFVIQINHRNRWTEFTKKQAIPI